MERVPVEILEMIFQKLDINSLVRCRRVCKKWFCVVKGVPIRELAISNEFSNVGNYFYTNMPVKRSNLLTLHKFNQFKSKFLKGLLTKLKCLYIKNAPDRRSSGFNLTNFNELFPNLIQLQIDYLKTRSGILKLQRLEILTILEAPRIYIRLQVPALTKFKTNCSLEYFFFETPSKVTHLSIFHYIGEVWRKFPNLQYLECKRAHALPGNDILKLLPSLKELHTSDIAQFILVDLLKQTKVERRLDFCVIYNGIKIDSYNDIQLFVNPSGLPRAELIEMATVHQPKLYKAISCITVCNYAQLTKVDRLSDRFLSDFFKTFLNIRRVEMNFEPNQHVDHTLLNKFIAQCTYIDELGLANAGLSQNFYDTLSVFCPYLTRLTIDEKPTNITNIDFLFGHIHLISFGVNLQISFENIQRAFAMLSFCTLRFKLQDKDIEVSSDLANRSHRLTVNTRMATFRNKGDTLEFLRDAYYSGLNYQEAPTEVIKEAIGETAKKIGETVKEEEAEGPAEEVGQVKVKIRKSGRVKRIRI